MTLSDQDDAEDAVDDPVLEPGVLDREHDLDPPAEVARHPVGRGEEDLGLVVVLEVADPGVLQELVDDADDPDVLGDAGNAGPEAADAADDQVDADPGLATRRRAPRSRAGSTSEFILAMIRAGQAGLGVLPLAVDQADQAVGQVPSGRRSASSSRGPASSRSGG